MARKTPKEKLEEKAEHLENILESLESPSMDHIKNLYFNRQGDHFLIARTYRGKLYARLDLELIDPDGPGQDPATEEIASRNERDMVTAKFTAPVKPQDIITETLTKKQVITRFEAQLLQVKIDLRNLDTPEAAMPKAKQKQKRKVFTTN